MPTEDPDIDVSTIDHLIKPYLDSTSGTSIRKFGSGQSNPTYLIEAGESKLVLRTKPAGALLKSAHDVGREFRVMKALEYTGLPVPRMIAFVDGDESPVGRDCFLMEHVAGRVFHDPALPGLNRAERKKVFDGMNDTLVKLHQIDPGAIGLGDFGRPGNYFQRQTSVWTRQYRSSRFRSNEDMDFLIEWLVQNMPVDDGVVTLVHGDFRLDNLIFKDETLEVAALLDWEISTLGHPFADISYQCMQWRMPYEGGLLGLGGLDRGSLGIPIEDEFVQRFCDRTLMPYPSNWNFYLAFGYFRLAAILEGVARRAVDGTASNPKMAVEYGECVPVLAQMAVGLAKERSS